MTTAATKSLNSNDWTLDSWIQDRCAEHGIDIGEPGKDWGGVFGIFYSGADDFSEEEALEIFHEAVAYGRMLEALKRAG